MLPQGYQLFPFFKNVGGLKTRISPASLDPNSASDLLNVDFDKTFGIRKRGGYAKLNETTVSDTHCVGLYNFVKEDGTKYLVGVFDSKIYKMDDFDGVWDDITGAVTLSGSNTAYVSFTVYQDTLIGTNGIDAPWKWDGTGNAAVLSISEFSLAKYVTTYKERLVFFATTESATYCPHRARWSNVGTIETYSAQDYTDEFAGDGSEIRGIGQLFDDVYVFKNGRTGSIKKMYYTGNSDVPFGVIKAGEVGTLSAGSVVATFLEGAGQGLVYFGADNKFRFFNGSYDVSISDDITPTIDELSFSQLKNIQATYYSTLNQVWFTCTTGASSIKDQVLVLDTRLNTWLKHNDMSLNVLAIATDNNDNEYLIGGGYIGYAYKMNTGTDDDGSNFTAYYQTAWLDLGSPMLNKKYGFLQLYLADIGDSDIDLTYDFDFGAGNTINKTITITTNDETFDYTFDFTLAGGDIAIKTIRLYQNGRSRYIRFKIGTTDSSSTAWTLYGFNVISKTMGVTDYEK